MGMNSGLYNLMTHFYVQFQMAKGFDQVKFIWHNLLRIRTAAMFVTVSLENVSHKIWGYVYDFHERLHMPSFNSPLINTIKPKDIYTFSAAAMLLFCIPHKIILTKVLFYF
jgi:hypothetical protein